MTVKPDELRISTLTAISKLSQDIDLQDLYNKLVDNFKSCVRDGYFGPEAKEEFKQAEEIVKEHNENEKQKVGKLTIEEGAENETK